MAVSNFSTANLQIASLPLDGGSTTQNIETSKIVKLSDQEYIQKYFSDIPVMIAVAKCESNFKQFEDDGTVVKNPKSTATGVMQIMASIHTDDAQKLGHDINTIEGNAAFARDLFNREGLKPWKSSAPCWSKTQAYSDYEQKIESAKLAVK